MPTINLSAKEKRNARRGLMVDKKFKGETVIGQCGGEIFYPISRAEAEAEATAIIEGQIIEHGHGGDYFISEDLSNALEYLRIARDKVKKYEPCQHEWHWLENEVIERVEICKNCGVDKPELATKQE
jgi:hypothetical protein